MKVNAKLEPERLGMIALFVWEDTNIMYDRQSTECQNREYFHDSEENMLKYAMLVPFHILRKTALELSRNAILLAEKELDWC